MVAYVVRRLLLAVLTVWAISVLSFIIIHLPPGDYVTSYIASMSASDSCQTFTASIPNSAGLKVLPRCLFICSDRPLTV